jgi:hypothetical protein
MTLSVVPLIATIPPCPARPGPESQLLDAFSSFVHPATGTYTVLLVVSTARPDWAVPGRVIVPITEWVDASRIVSSFANTSEREILLVFGFTAISPGNPLIVTLAARTLEMDGSVPPVGWVEVDVEVVIVWPALLEDEDASEAVVDELVVATLDG